MNAGTILKSRNKNVEIYILTYDAKKNARILQGNQTGDLPKLFQKNLFMKPVICAGGFMVKKNKFLFGKRSKKKTWAAGKWDIVGGKALKNENPFYTLRREVFEETGVVVLDAELMTTMHIFDRNEEDFFIYHIYRITHWRMKPRNVSKEHSKLKWLTRLELGEVDLALPEYLSLIDKWRNDVYLGVEKAE